MIDPCPNQACLFLHSNEHVVRDGKYFRKDDSRLIHRFRCTVCQKRFSSATKTLEYRQRKRRINHYVYFSFASGMSQRRMAKKYNVDKKTIERKLLYLAKKARLENAQLLQQLKEVPVTHLQIDDLITSIHSKLKPVSISVAIDASTRRILAAETGVIPAFGKLAAISRRKYGKRKSEHFEKLQNLFETIAPFVHQNAEIRSDEHQTYPIFINRYFPQAKFLQFKSERSSVAGMGELKRKKYDPLFSINHTLAMFRYGINRLARRTWSTSKCIERLKDHVAIYIHFHNHVLIKL